MTPTDTIRQALDQATDMFNQAGDQYVIRFSNGLCIGKFGLPTNAAHAVQMDQITAQANAHTYTNGNAEHAQACRLDDALYADMQSLRRTLDALESVNQ